MYRNQLVAETPPGQFSSTGKGEPMGRAPRFAEDNPPALRLPNNPTQRSIWQHANYLYLCRTHLKNIRYEKTHIPPRKSSGGNSVSHRTDGHLRRLQQRKPEIQPVREPVRGGGGQRPLQPRGDGAFRQHPGGSADRQLHLGLHGRLPEPRPQHHGLLA